MCCHDGAFVGREEAMVLRRLAAEEEDFFEDVGVMLPSRQTEMIHEDNYRLLTRPMTYDNRAGFPDHFPKTRCVFLTVDGKCSLQLLAIARGQHPWYWKPFSCWLHPLSVDEGPPPELVLHDEDSDPHRREGYPGFIVYTECGRTRPGEEPAWRVLSEELEFLGAILGRDLLDGIQ